MSGIIRIGQLISPEHLEGEFTHASTPYPLVRDNGVRILFNRRDSEGKSHVFSVDLDLAEEKPEIKLKTLKHLLVPGTLGTFDDSGVSVGCIFQSQFYYMGWNLGVTVPWRNSIGVVEYDFSRNEMKRQRKSPILDRNEEDPYTLSYPWILPSKSGHQMLYGSNKRWDTSKTDIDHVLKRAISSDGKKWEPQGVISIEGIPEANAFCRPSVLQYRGYFVMAYAFRQSLYQIGFAISKDLQNWRNTQVMGPEVGANWESQEVTYPALFQYQETTYLLYCGNGYGRTGFGIAKLNMEKIFGNFIS